jgi:hypothetical protein
VNCREVTEHSVHWRRRGSCTNDRRSSESRVTQIGSWWETIAASCPRAASRASWIAANIRATISL